MARRFHQMLLCRDTTLPSKLLAYGFGALALVVLLHFRLVLAGVRLHLDIGLRLRASQS